MVFEVWCGIIFVGSYCCAGPDDAREQAEAVTGIVFALLETRLDAHEDR
jgi:hypothetical protein